MLLRVKRRRKEEATEREDPERLVTEIEMLKVVLFLACPKIGKEELDRTSPCRKAVVSCFCCGDGDPVALTANHYSCVWC